MGHYVSIRGWIELDDELTDQFRMVIDKSLAIALENDITVEDAEFYARGWVIPDEYINWTRYIFYGADIRLRGLSFMKSLLEEIAQVQLEDGECVEFVKGIFFVDDEGNDESLSLVWELKGGQLVETSRK